jgi:hypothetical protein
MHRSAELRSHLWRSLTTEPTLNQWIAVIPGYANHRDGVRFVLLDSMMLSLVKTTSIQILSRIRSTLCSIDMSGLWFNERFHSKEVEAMSHFPAASYSPTQQS